LKNCYDYTLVKYRYITFKSFSKFLGCGYASTVSYAIAKHFGLHQIQISSRLINGLNKIRGEKEIKYKLKDEEFYSDNAFFLILLFTIKFFFIELLHSHNTDHIFSMLIRFSGLTLLTHAFFLN
jgi:hypothetical protein